MNKRVQEQALRVCSCTLLSRPLLWIFFLQTWFTSIKKHIPEEMCRKSVSLGFATTLHREPSYRKGGRGNTFYQGSFPHLSIERLSNINNVVWYILILSHSFGFFNCFYPVRGCLFFPRGNFSRKVSPLTPSKAFVGEAPEAPGTRGQGSGARG